MQLISAMFDSPVGGEGHRKVLKFLNLMFEVLARISGIGL